CPYCVLWSLLNRSLNIFQPVFVLFHNFRYLPSSISFPPAPKTCQVPSSVTYSLPSPYMSVVLNFTPLTLPAAKVSSKSFLSASLPHMGSSFGTNRQASSA